MSKNVVIVESPSKAKTIEKFLGPEYHVLSSKGHIRDIEGVGKNSMGIDFDHHYAPNYVIDPQKTHILAVLHDAVKKADKVWLASDEDREGEAIAWHLQQVLNLNPNEANRIVFHEITKTAIQDAIQHPRKIDYNLVNAQQARRVLDRIVGFELSPILWRKVTTGLSAGRVQSVAVRLIVEREREIEDFKEVSQYRISADFIGKNQNAEDFRLHTELNHRFASKEEAVDFLRSCAATSFHISQVSDKPVKRTPAPPFTTSSLQQEAARKLKFTVSKTMRLAQALYEAGKITYMRTDSVNLSSLAIATAKQEIVGDPKLGAKYHQARQYHTVSKGAQEAHEAIRPTYMNVHSAGANADEKRLYELIWRRTLASQMADAELLATRVEITSSDLPYSFVANGEVVLFDGFMRAYVQSTDDENDSAANVLPKVSLGLAIKADEYVAQQTFTKAPPRYTEASLVKRMEELGIGRPSTYATTIETIQTRNYVVRGNVSGYKREFNVVTMKNDKLSDRQKTEMVGQDAHKLLPTDLGRITNDFLVEHFSSILSYDFTAKEEENFDRIAAGDAEWTQIVDNFYHTFHSDIVNVPVGKVAGRLLGTDPQTGEQVLAKVSKIGPCIQIGDAEKGKPRFASLKPGQSLFTITLAEALDLFEELKSATKTMMLDGEEATLGTGKYGPYVRYEGAFISLPKGTDIHTISEDNVREVIAQHQQQMQPLRTFGDIHIMQGRFGAYIKTPEGNFRLPKSANVDALTIEECQSIIASAQKNQKYARKHSKV